MGATSCFHIEDSQGTGPAFIFDVNNGRDIISQEDDGTEVFALMPNGHIRTTTSWGYREFGVGIGDIAADNDDYTYPLLRCKTDITITHASIAFDTTTGLNATNYETIYLEQTGNTTDLSTLTNVSTAFTLGVPRAFTIATSADQDHLAAGQTLQLRTAAAASGSALYGGVVSITFTIDQEEDTVGASATDYVIKLVNEVGTAAHIIHDHDTRDHLSIRKNGIEKFRIDCDGKMHGGSDGSYPADQYYYQTVNVGSIATGATGKYPIFKPIGGDVTIKNIYFGSTSTAAVDSQTAFWQLKIVDSNANILCDAYVHGPYGGGTALVKGQLYDMGDVNPAWARLTTSEHIQLEVTETGTASTIDGMTICICYVKNT